MNNTKRQKLKETNQEENDDSYNVEERPDQYNDEYEESEPLNEFVAKKKHTIVDDNIYVSNSAECIEDDDEDDEMEQDENDRAFICNDEINQQDTDNDNKSEIDESSVDGDNDDNDEEDSVTEENNPGAPRYKLDENGKIHLDLGTPLNADTTLFYRIKKALKDQAIHKRLYHEKDIDTYIEQLHEYWIPPGTLNEVQIAQRSIELMGRSCVDQKEEHKGINAAKQNALEVVNMMIQLLRRNKLIGQEGTGDKFVKLIQQVNDAIESMYKSRLHLWGQKNEENRAQVTIPGVIQKQSGFGDVIGANGKKITPTQHLIKYVLDQAAKNNYRKLNGNIYQEETMTQVNPKVLDQNGNPTKTIYNVKSYKQRGSIKDFIMEVADISVSEEMNANLTSGMQVLNHVIQHVNDTIDARCPKLERERCVWSFTNGLYFAKKNLLIPHRVYGAPKDPQYERQVGKTCATKFFEYPLTDMGEIGQDYTIDKKGRYRDLDSKVIYNPKLPESVQRDDEKGVNVKINKKPPRTWMDIPTPIFDKILQNQRMDRATIKWLYVMCGRLMLPLGHEHGGDNWQLTMLLYGRAGTGKSTIAKHIVSMYDAADVFNLESDSELVFGLETAVDTKIWTIFELKQNIKLSAARYQLMTEGARMSIPRKGLKAITIDWNMPGLMCGNETLPFPDAQNSVGRRTMPWEFLYKVTETDTNLDKKLKRELPNMLRKCYWGYMYTKQWVGSRGIWDKNVLPLSFSAAQMRMKKQIDDVAAFVDTRLEISDHQHHVIPLVFLQQQLQSTLTKAIAKDKNKFTIDMLVGTLEAMKGVQLFKIKPLKTHRAERDAANKKLYDLEQSNLEDDEDDVDLEDEVDDDDEKDNDETTTDDNKNVDFDPEIFTVRYNGNTYEKGVFVRGLWWQLTTDKVKNQSIVYSVDDGYNVKEDWNERLEKIQKEVDERERRELLLS